MISKTTSISIKEKTKIKTSFIIMKKQLSKVDLSFVSYIMLRSRAVRLNLQRKSFQAKMYNLYFYMTAKARLVLQNYSKAALLQLKDNSQRNLTDHKLPFKI
jgi:hypothetical protein